MDNDTWQRLSSAIAARRELAISLIQELVRRPSIDSEAEVQAYIQDFWRQRGVETDLWSPSMDELRSHRAFVPVEYDYSHRPDQVVFFKGAGGGRSLALNGHVDVVPVDPAPWTYGGPWSGAYVDGKIYGRGSVDMKGGVAAGMLVLDALLECGIKLRGDLHMQFVADEENGGNGTLGAILRGYRADATIFLEPTSPSRLVVSCRGAQFFRITVPGLEAPIEHTMTTVNVIEKAFLLFKAVQDYACWRVSTADHPLYDWDPTKIPVAVCKIQAGSWPSTFAAQCTMEGSLECLPGEDIAVVREDFRRYLLQVASQDAWLSGHPPVIEWFGLWFESAQTPLDSDLIVQFKESYASVTGSQPQVMGGGGDDLRLSILYANSPSVLFGPSGAAFHSTDEYVEVDSVMKVAQIVGRFALDWCGVEA
jgi:acetylornithine deacetylase